MEKQRGQVTGWELGKKSVKVWGQGTDWVPGKKKAEWFVGMKGK